MWIEYRCDLTAFGVLEKYFPTFLDEIGLTEDHIIYSLSLVWMIAKWLEVSPDNFKRAENYYLIYPLKKTTPFLEFDHNLIFRALHYALEDSVRDVAEIKKTVFTEELKQSFRARIRAE